MKRVVVGISGGVDSSVAAKLLIDQGYEVIGLFMHNWEQSEGGECSSATDWADASAVCNKLKIPHYSINFAAEYMDRVFKYFLEEYKAGRTPNPDVLCNREIKFAPFKDYAMRLGAHFIATGHYCDIDLENTFLLKAADQNKDQTYFLNQVTTTQLTNVLFPLGKLNKPQVRIIAQQHGLITAKKKDSTGICFIGERKFKEFLQQYLPACPGQIRDTSGKVIGKHDGLMYYTLGQRRGLGIGGVVGSSAERWYVVKKDLVNNILYVSCGEGEELLSTTATCGQLNIIGKFDFPTKLDCMVKTRYRQTEQPATAYLKNGNLMLEFAQPQRAVTPGQYAVIYVENRCLGGAVIISTNCVAISK